MKRTPFAGFRPEAIQFLDELAVHNRRDWFVKHKARYESDVLQPALAFVAAMAPPLAGISPHFVAVPKRTGGSVMRIYRDTRFAKDKTPYKTNVGIHFRHALGKDVHAPGYYVHIAPEECFLGCGIWHPDGKTLAKIRTAIDTDPAGWKRATRGKAFGKTYALRGDALKRPPKGYDAAHPLIDDLKRKDFIGMAELTLDEVFGDDMVKTVATRFRAGKPLMRFLCDAIGVPF